MEREFQGPEGRGPLELMAFSLNGELRARHPIVSATFASALGFEGERRERLEAFVKQLGAPPSDQLVSSWHRVRQEVSAERRLRIELVRNKVGSDAARSSASSGLCRAPGSSRAAREAARVGGE